VILEGMLENVLFLVILILYGITIYNGGF